MEMHLLVQSVTLLCSPLLVSLTSSSSVFSMDRSPAYAPGDMVLPPQVPLFPAATTPEPPQSHQPQRRHLMKQLCCVPGAVLGPVHTSLAQLSQRGDVIIPVVQTGEVGTERRDSLPLSPLWSWSGYSRCHYPDAITCFLSGTELMLTLCVSISLHDA